MTDKFWEKYDVEKNGVPEKEQAMKFLKKYDKRSSSSYNHNFEYFYKRFEKIMKKEIPEKEKKIKFSIEVYKIY